MVVELNHAIIAYVAVGSAGRTEDIARLTKFEFEEPIPFSV